MGEKGNLLGIGDKIFANLVEQSLQFWLDYEQYRQSRAGRPAPAATRYKAGPMGSKGRSVLAAYGRRLDATPSGSRNWVWGLT
jgi:hypothetical protein